ncbi:MAG: maleylacetoacetate isomerase [Pseudomonadota bacterium]
MQFHSYFRSSAAYRVRIALALKGLAYKNIPVDLRKGEQGGEAYRRLNPQALVPTLVDGPHVLSQSLAIIEYLEETHPEPPLLPKTAPERARVRGLALAVACDIHPLNNLRVLNYLADPLGHDEAARQRWARHWIGLGLAAIERELEASSWTGRFCHGDAPGLADICLVPQVYNANRVAAPLEDYPLIRRIDAAARALPAFEIARPEAQPDCPPELRQNPASPAGQPGAR